MKKKEYERPSIGVVELKQQCHILAGSDVTATMDGTFTEESASREFIFEDEDF